MPNGTVIDGPDGLKKVLLARKDEFVESLADKLLTYALGRGPEYYDQPAVREIRRQAERNDYKFSSLVLAIVNSVPFEMRRTPNRDRDEEVSRPPDVSPRHGRGWWRFRCSTRWSPALAAATRSRDPANRLRLHRQRHHHEGLDSSDRGSRFRIHSNTLKPIEPFRDRLLVLTRSGAAQRRVLGRRRRATMRAREPPGSRACIRRRRKGSTSITRFRWTRSWRMEFGKQTPLPSLELGLEDVRLVGGCDSGYSCAYSNTLWPGASPTTPLPYETNPRAVFERLFGDGETTDPAARAMRSQRESQHCWIS